MLVSRTTNMSSIETNDVGEIGGADKGVSTEPIDQCRRVVSVVLAGGSGTRLWPMSRENFPKHLIDVVGSESLLQTTVSRMEAFPAEWQVSGFPIIVCGEEHRFVTAEQLRASGVDARI